uniref:Uncharacterized protein n=1 Tax=Oryza glumipatula TaxID=40148 RepID=A0A0D9YF32_9ORYZ
MHRMGTQIVPCSLRAVNRMQPVSSPMRHSAILVGRAAGPAPAPAPAAARPFWTTVLELSTLATSVWPPVPGLSWSTLTNTGFLFAAAAMGTEKRTLESSNG